MISPQPVVLVDDNQDDIRLFSVCYRMVGIQRELLTFLSGEAFLEHMEQVSKRCALWPSVVLLDINMPGLSGFEVIQNLRARSEFSQFPTVLMLSHSDEPKDFERAHQLGANGFFTKPIHMKENLALIREIETRASESMLESTTINGS